MPETDSRHCADVSDPQKRVKRLSKETDYYRKIAQEAGRRYLREVDHLSRVIVVQQATEKELLEKTRLNQILLDAFPCVAMLLTPDRKILVTNEAGRRAGAAVGRTCFESWSRFKAPCRWCLAQTALEKGQAQHLEVATLGIIWDAHWVPITPSLYLHYAFDITEERKMEMQLRQFQRFEAVGQMAGVIAHNFNNLLMGIQGNISLLLEDLPVGDPKREVLSTLTKLVKSGGELTKGLLSYGRMEPPEARPVDINRLVKETGEACTAGRKGIMLRLDLSPEALVVDGDVAQIEQSLLNLCTNGIQAMPDGGTISITTKLATLDGTEAQAYKLKPGKYSVITVSDTGTGMDPETADRIFEPFFTTKGSGIGTGLGLASVYKVVKVHGGYIGVQTAKGSGTAFSIYLPFSNKRFQTISTPAPRPVGPSEWILLVDNDKAVLEITAKLLNTLGYRVLQARDLKEALERHGPNLGMIDLVILDGDSADTFESDALDRLKRIKPGVKGLLCSGHIRTKEAVGDFGRGFNGFIRKPFNLNRLASKIREILDPV
jgi:signal transduction histidine kinase/CheY-like chemotaxis protein